MTTTPWPKAISFFPVSVGGAGRAVGGVARHGDILAFLVEVCGSPTEAVAAGSPYRYPLWLARALNSAIYDVKWDYESDRAIAKIADFYAKIAVFIINLYCCAPFCNYT